jgi:hypothetical protein
MRGAILVTIVGGLLCAIIIAAYLLFRVNFSLANKAIGPDTELLLHQVKFGNLAENAKWLKRYQVFGTLPPQTQLRSRSVQLIFVPTSGKSDFSSANCKLKISPLDSAGFTKPFQLDKHDPQVAFCVFLDLGVPDPLAHSLRIDNLVLESD